MTEKLLKYHQYPVKGRFGILCQVHCLQRVYPPHKHNYIEMEVLLSGTLTHELNGNRFFAEKGACWCLQTDDIHSIVVHTPITICNICIDRNEAPVAVQQFLQALTTSRTGQLSAENLTSAQALFEALQSALTDESAYAKERTTGYALLLLSLLAENSQPSLPQPSTASSPHIRNAVRYIATHYDKPLTLSEVAANLFLTPSYFSKMFAKSTGYTFSEYVTSVRLEHAKRLLTETTLPIAVIAFRCGFTTFSSFSRQFRKCCGCTPTAYRHRKTRDALATTTNISV